MSAGRSSRRGECGETLIELIVAVAIMGTSIVVLVAALAATVANATRQRIDAKGQAALTTYAERARAVPFIPCATPAEYTAVLPDESADFDVVVTRVASWDGERYRAGTTLAADAGAGTIEVADAAGLPARGPYDLRVASDSGIERMRATAGFGTATLTVTGAAGAAGDAVYGCPPDPPGTTSGSTYQAQLLDLAATGPAIPGLGATDAYHAATTVAKRGPLHVPTLTADDPARVLTADDPAQPATAKAGEPVRFELTATLADASAPHGAITFSIFGADQFDADTGACAEPPLGTVTADVSGNGTVTARLPFTPAKAGPEAYRWIAAYGGDEANEGVTVTCGADAQRIAVAKATPTLSATLRTPTAVLPATPAAVVGDETTAIARLVGGAKPTGTMTFALFGPDDADCSGRPVTRSSPVTDNGDVTSDPVAFDEPGTYRWRATFVPDADGAVSNEPPDTTPCPASEDQIVTVTEP